MKKDKEAYLSLVAGWDNTVFYEKKNNDGLGILIMSFVVFFSLAWGAIAVEKIMDWHPPMEAFGSYQGGLS